MLSKYSNCDNIKIKCLTQIKMDAKNSAFYADSKFVEWVQEYFQKMYGQKTFGNYSKYKKLKIPNAYIFHGNFWTHVREFAISIFICKHLHVLNTLIVCSQKETISNIFFHKIFFSLNISVRIPSCSENWRPLLYLLHLLYMLHRHW
jgi:hypothetical protein